MKIHKGDKVKILAGKYKGVLSEVEQVFTKSKAILVKDVNIVTRHLKMQEGAGGRVKVSKPIDASKAQVVCPKCDKPTRVGYKLDKNKKVRVCKKCNEEI